MKELKISLPEEKFEQLSIKAKESQFNSTEEYVNFVLSQITEEKTKSTESEEEKAQKQRLMDLGYI